ncbi:hypothetical protein [Pyxidicoccus trucidator]|uniref:hypothetical protein n=1 Tax=Pyxidicoccus trucidator TaxID=2709662 RepID=UPI0013DB0EBD|nr:hypothetical protein [Pyxidicoccus trucidator]
MYPPKLQVDDFQSVNLSSLSLELSCPLESVKRCGIRSLALTPHPAEARCFTAPHSPLEPEAAGRYRLAPGAEEELKLSWTFDGAPHIRSAVIELYMRSSVPSEPFWQRVIDWKSVELRADSGECAFDGSLHGGEREEGGLSILDLAVNVPKEKFPLECLSVEHAPYLLKMTITPESGAVAEVGSAWIYLDVVATEVRLSPGDEDWLRASPDGDKDRAITRAMWEAKSFPAEKGSFAKVLLPSNIFSVNTDEWHALDSDVPFAKYEAAWGNGPELPLVAELLVSNSQGESVSAPKAVAGTELLWDWSEPPSPPVTLNGGVTASEDEEQINEYLKRYLKGTASSSAFLKGNNCHVDHGGKSGSSADKDRVLALVSQENRSGFPFEVRRPGPRSWAAISRIPNDGPCPGKTGVIFQPSRIAGDSYRVSACWRYDGAGTGVHQLDDAHEDIQATVIGTTGTFQVWRQLHLVQYLVQEPEALQVMTLAPSLEASISGKSPKEEFEELDAALTAAFESGNFSYGKWREHWFKTGKDPEWTLTELEMDDAEGKARRLRELHGQISSSQVTHSPSPSSEPSESAWKLEIERLRRRYTHAFTEFVCLFEQPTSIESFHEKVSTEVQGRNSAVLSAAVKLDEKEWRKGAYVLHFRSYSEFRKEYLRESSGKTIENLLEYFSSNGPDERQKRMMGPTEEELSDLYEKSNKGWAQWILECVIEKELHGASEGVYFLDLPGCCRRDREEGGNSLEVTILGYAMLFPSMEGKVAVFANLCSSSDYAGAKKLSGANKDVEQSMGVTAAHELGHSLFLAHAPLDEQDRPSNPGSTAGVEPGFHDSRMMTCLMGYHRNSQYFCGLCLLRLRGWSRQNLKS